MKVAHRDDYDTHAVIGGNNVQEFGIAQTAEFFTVLSNTLYSNKPLAVIREVLCNAWDAHIVSGRTNLPVEITIDEEKLIIRDYGHGIPHDLIHGIYCVYGNSTKENDGNQTGGFGLGSKAPFAYSDHFTVSNHHAGLKTVHAISRGSARTQGKPDRRVMVSVPTQESGVEVMIPVKSKQDMHHFISIARDVAAFGEMNVNVNGQSVPKVPISTAERNMFLTTRKIGTGINRINIRYGNVVYPVSPDAEYITLYNKLAKILEEIPSRNGYGANDFSLILQAPANSISVTPSRESLSLTETTINTLNGLFTDIIDFMETASDTFEEKLLNEQAKAIDHLYLSGRAERILFVENLLTDQFGPKRVIDQYGNPVSEITNMVELANYFLRHKRKLGDRLSRKLEVQRIRKLIDGGYRRQGDLKTLDRLYASKRIERSLGKMFYKAIFRPLLKKVAKHGVLHPKHLYVVTPSHRSQSRMGWTHLHNYTPDTRAFLPLLQGVVIVTHNKVTYEGEFHSLTGLQDTVPNNLTRMVYLAPRTKGHAEAAVEHFEKLGYLVINFASIVEKYRVKNYVAPVPKVKEFLPEPKREKKLGLPLLSSSITKYGFNDRAHMGEGVERSEDYEYVIKPYQLSRREYGQKFFPWGDSSAKDIASLFGSNIGICVSDPQVESQMRQGKKDGARYIVESIVKDYLTNPRIRTYVEIKKGQEKNRSYRFMNLLRLSEYSSVLKKAFTLPDTMTEHDLKIIEIFENISRQVPLYHGVYSDGSWERLVVDARKETEAWTAAQKYIDLAEQVEASKALSLLDLNDMYYALQKMDKSPNMPLRIFIETSVLNALKI